MKKRLSHLPTTWKIVGGIALGVIVVFVVSGLIFSPVFCASQYKDLIQSETGDFATDVSEISWSQIPVVDRDSAERLGSRKLGEKASKLISGMEDGTFAPLDNLSRAQAAQMLANVIENEIK